MDVFRQHALAIFQEVLDCSMHTVVRSGNWCNGFHAHPLRRKVFIKHTKQVCVIFFLTSFCIGNSSYANWRLTQSLNVTAFTDYWFRSATGSNSFRSTTFYFFSCCIFRFVLFFVFMFVVVAGCYYWWQELRHLQPWKLISFENRAITLTPCSRSTTLTIDTKLVETEKWPL